MTEVKLITEPLSASSIQDEFELRMLDSIRISAQEWDAFRGEEMRSVTAPVLQHIVDKSMRPFIPSLRGTTTQGYTFFEENILPPQSIENARRHFDRILTGSSWCEEVLRAHGLAEVRTIIQGVDPTIFHAYNSVKEYFRDRFVVFSGGKFELRKGQDVVIRAYKTLQDRHADVLLVNSWYNQWPDSAQTMSASPHLRFRAYAEPYRAWIGTILKENGIDLKRVIALGPMPNIMMARVYRNSDVGLFPNRCEGGSNLVMMEYMACGRPVVASYNSGHRDVLTDQNSIRTMRFQRITIVDNDRAVAIWDDPDIEEVTEQLEWAYQNREALTEIGARAGAYMAGLTWERSARAFLHSLLS